MEEERSIESTLNGFQVDYECKKCGNKQKANVFPYINFSQNPEYYALVKDLSIFKVTCEKCGDTKLVQFDTLIVDETHKYFLYLLIDKSLYNKFRHQIKYFIETVLNKDDKYDLSSSEYHTRLVFTPNDLIEKMSIFELGLDDEAIEIIKYGIFEKTIEDRLIYDCLYFDGMNNANLAFVSFSSKTTTKPVKRFEIDFNFYNKIVDDLRNFKNRHRDYFEVIDEDWVKSKFERNSEKSSE